MYVAGVVSAVLMADGHTGRDPRSAFLFSNYHAPELIQSSIRDHSSSTVAMAPRAKCCQSNGLRRCKALREVSSNVCWLHLGAGAISARSTLHSVWRHTSLVCSYSSFLLSFAMTIETLFGGNSADMEAIHLAIKLFSLNLTSFMSLLEICSFHICRISTRKCFYRHCE